MHSLNAPSPGARPCLTCGEAFPVTLDYWPRDPLGRGGTRPHCLTCHRAKRRDAYARDPEPTRARMRQRYAERATQFPKALASRRQGPSSCQPTEDNA